jgi:nucleoside-diphosphate-sugar epimerase
MAGERFLVTGAMGCVGAWVVRILVEESVEVATFDSSTDDRRLRQLMEEKQLAHIERITGDITEYEDVAAAIEDRTHIIHLAALQVPLVRANPSLGASVNVQGTVNVFEAVKSHGVSHLAYASSAAVYGHPSNYATNIVGPEAPRLPETLYGVFKVANEDTAKVYWRENRVASIGLRPYTVYGPGRDQGFTAAPTLALEAAVKREPYHIPYGGVAGFNFAPDVARTFIAAARAEPDGAVTYSMAGDIVSVAEFVRVCHDVTGTWSITHGDDPLPFPDGLDDTALRERLGLVPHTPLRLAIEEAAEFFASQAAVP